jgi:hypothetical protein
VPLIQVDEVAGLVVLAVGLPHDRDVAADQLRAAALGTLGERDHHRLAIRLPASVVEAEEGRERRQSRRSLAQNQLPRKESHAPTPPVQATNPEAEEQAIVYVLPVTGLRTTVVALRSD